MGLPVVKCPGVHRRGVLSLRLLGEFVVCNEGWHLGNSVSAPRFSPSTSSWRNEETTELEK